MKLNPNLDEQEVETTLNTLARYDDIDNDEFVLWYKKYENQILESGIDVRSLYLVMEIFHLISPELFDSIIRFRELILYSN